MMKTTMTAVVLSASVLAFSGIAFAEEGHVLVDTINAETLNKFRQQTAGLREQLKEKELELRWLYGYESLNVSEVDRLEANIREIKAKIKSLAPVSSDSCTCL
jgi:peptidoglycan hydrolase CwlO-like protein